LGLVALLCAVAADDCASELEAAKAEEKQKAVLTKGMRVTTKQTQTGVLDSEYEDKKATGKKKKKKWWVKLDSGGLALKPASELRAAGESLSVSKKWAKYGNCMVKAGLLEGGRVALDRALGGDGTNTKVRDALRKVLEKLGSEYSKGSMEEARFALGNASALLHIWEGEKQAQTAADVHWGAWAAGLESGAVPLLPEKLSQDVVRKDSFATKVEGYLNKEETDHLKGYVLEERKVRERRYRPEDRQWCFNDKDAEALAKETLGAQVNADGCADQVSHMMEWRKKVRPRDTVYLQKGHDPRLDTLLWRLAVEWFLPFALAEQAPAVRLPAVEGAAARLEGSLCVDGGAVTVLVAVSGRGKVTLDGVTVELQPGDALLWKRWEDGKCVQEAAVLQNVGAERVDLVALHYAGAPRYVEIAPRKPGQKVKTRGLEPSVSLGPMVPTSVRGRAETTECDAGDGRLWCRRVVGKPEMGNEQSYECGKYDKCSSCSRGGCAWCVAEGKCVVHFKDRPSGYNSCLFGEMHQVGLGGAGTCDSASWPYPERRKQNRKDYSQRFQVPPKMKIDWYGSGSSSSGGDEDPDDKDEL